MATDTTPIEDVWDSKGNLPTNAIVATADGKYPALDGSLITGIAGGGDMNTAVYDPTAVSGDAFDMDNMAEGATTKILTDTERTKLSGIEASADVTDSANVVTAIDGATLTDAGTPAATDQILIKDAGTGALQTADFSEFGGGGGGGDVATDTIWDAKGDLAAGTGADTASRLPIGTNDQVLTADSAEATGMKWAAPSTAGLSAATDH